MVAVAIINHGTKRVYCPSFKRKINVFLKFCFVYMGLKSNLMVRKNLDYNTFFHLFELWIFQFSKISIWFRVVKIDYRWTLQNCDRKKWLRSFCGHRRISTIYISFHLEFFFSNTRFVVAKSLSMSKHVCRGYLFTHLLRKNIISQMMIASDLITSKLLLYFWHYTKVYNSDIIQ